MAFTRSLAAAILTAACCLFVPAAGVLAQSPSSPPNASTSAPDLSDRKLDAAAAAIERVVALQKDYFQRFTTAEAPAEKERVVAEAKNEIAKAIAEQGISVEEYVSILDVARDDPDVRGKILRRIPPTDE